MQCYDCAIKRYEMSMKNMFYKVFAVTMLTPLLYGASSSQTRWEKYYAHAGVYPDYETRLIWQDDSTVGREKMEYAQAKQYCRSLTLANTHGWRLPTAQELVGLYADEKKMRRISHIPSGSFWTSTPQDEGENVYIKGVRYPGAKSGFTSPRNTLVVRCVRTGAKVAPSPAVAAVPASSVNVKQKKAKQKHHTVQARKTAEHERALKEAAEAKRQAQLRAERAQKARAEAEARRIRQEQERLAHERFALLQQTALIDTKSGLAWQDSKEVKARKLPWKEASQYCKALRIAGYDDWALPSAEELEKLYSHKDRLRNDADAIYWSSTVIDPAEGTVEYVDFSSGARFWTTKDRAFNVRCVRHPMAVRLATMSHSEESRKKQN